MGGKKGGENTKKAAGNAKKAEAAAQKEAATKAKAAAIEDVEWSKGAKSNAKKQTEAEKKAETARKKQERDAQLAEEEASQRATPKGANAKSASKKSKPGGPPQGRPLDLSQLENPDHPPPGPAAATAALNATGINNALDALSLTTQPQSTINVDRHPERRYKAAFAAYAERRRDEIARDYPTLKKHNRDELLRKEFEKSEENPFNQPGVVKYHATQDEIRQERERVRDGIEGRLA